MPSGEITGAHDELIAKAPCRECAILPGWGMTLLRRNIFIVAIRKQPRQLGEGRPTAIIFTDFAGSWAALALGDLPQKKRQRAVTAHGDQLVAIVLRRHAATA